MSEKPNLSTQVSENPFGDKPEDGRMNFDPDQKPRPGTDAEPEASKQTGASESPFQDKQEDGWMKFDPTKPRS